jgi:DNA-binding MarR family transcriptional regulator
MMNLNSTLAFRQIQPKLPKSEHQVMKAFGTACSYLSREQIASLSDMKLSGVCGRVNALVAKGLLEVEHKGKSATTGKTVDFLIPTDKGEQYIEVYDAVANHVS